MTQFKKGDFIKMLGTGSMSGVLEIVDEDRKFYLLKNEKGETFRKLKVEVGLYGEKMDEKEFKKYAVEKGLRGIMEDIAELISNNQNLTYKIIVKDGVVSIEGILESEFGDIPQFSTEYEIKGGL